MTRLGQSAAIVGAALFAPASAFAADETLVSAGWHAQTLGEALLHTAIFALAGVALAIVCYKLFDLFTPGDLHKEIVENKNVAAAVLGAAIILGACILVAAAITG